ncbi:hypothetical protein C1645_819439 [Glomus cerebriforme]|uniref:Uncharacterized protein n=1 Tax=Glomus cerebriforme TaxID=658196 RepID=A0A397TAC7_9GLOM|nr:hypothetical protein C1645_819439 [Glomus cerebriforme]
MNEGKSESIADHGYKVHSSQFDCISAFRLWKSLGYKKAFEEELQGQLRSYFDHNKPYDVSYSSDYDVPYSLCCECLFSSLFGKRKTNLNIQTIELIAKIYHYIIKGDLFNEQCKEEESVQNEEQDEEEEISNADEKLSVENAIDLGPWVFIDNSTLLTITHKYNSKGNEDWNPDKLANNN